ncbi:ubiquitin like 3 isoform X1 [Dermacentor variabilis]|uniref:ubiquitin like 3 isoform X1 n=1 Tax=Dermacentor variabilis TaxID=34621 RepID=UPI003F5B08E7
MTEPTRCIFCEPNVLSQPVPAFFLVDSTMGFCSSGEGTGDRVNLRLILVSGKTKEFAFSPNDSAAEIAQHVFDNWPQEWSDEAVSKAEILRLIYQGRFLHGNVTLGALQLPLGKTTVMHLVPRENLPEPNSQDQRQKSKERSSGCCSASCSIL